MTIKGKRESRTGGIWRGRHSTDNSKTTVIHTQATTKYKNIVVDEKGKVHLWRNKTVSKRNKGTRRGTRK